MVKVSVGDQVKDIPKSDTPMDALAVFEKAGLPVNKDAVVSVNGQVASFKTPVKDGDIVVATPVKIKNG